MCCLGFVEGFGTGTGGVMAFSTARFSDNYFLGESAVSNADWMSLEQLNCCESRLFSLFDRFGIYRRERRVAIGSERQIIKADDGNILRNSQSGFPQCGDRTDGDRIVSREQCRWTRSTIQDFPHCTIATFHTEIATGDQSFVESYSRAFNRSPKCSESFSGSDVTNWRVSDMGDAAVT